MFYTWDSAVESKRLSAMACLQLSRFRAALRQSLARGASTFPAGADVVSLPDPPYEYSALEPYISAEIMELHHSKHHQAYVTNYNKALEQWAESESKQDAVSAPKISSALHFNGGGSVVLTGAAQHFVLA